MNTEIWNIDKRIDFLTLSLIHSTNIAQAYFDKNHKIQM